MREENLSEAEVAQLDRLKQAKKLIEEVIAGIEAPEPKAVTVKEGALPEKEELPEESTVEASDASEKQGDWRQGERFRVGAEEA